NCRTLCGSWLKKTFPISVRLRRTAAKNSRFSSARLSRGIENIVIQMRKSSDSIWKACRRSQVKKTVEEIAQSDRTPAHQTVLEDHDLYPSPSGSGQE